MHGRTCPEVTASLSAGIKLGSQRGKNRALTLGAFVSDGTRLSYRQPCPPTQVYCTRLTDTLRGDLKRYR